MKEIFMISQLITRLSKTTKLEKYQQDKVIAYFEKKYRLIAADLSKKKALDADSRAIQHINFTGETKSTVPYTIIYCILEQSKETILETAKRTTKVL